MKFEVSIVEFSYFTYPFLLTSHVISLGIKFREWEVGIV